MQSREKNGNQKAAEETIRGDVVEMMRLELTTSYMRSKRSSQLSYTPNCQQHALYTISHKVSISIFEFLKNERKFAWGFFFA